MDAKWHLLVVAEHPSLPFVQIPRFSLLLIAQMLISKIPHDYKLLED